jgi:hypothetical protein
VDVPEGEEPGANTEAKLLMLEHAFERLGCITDLEWPDVRTNLRRRLAAARARNSEPVQ